MQGISGSTAGQRISAPSPAPLPGAATGTPASGGGRALVADWDKQVAPAVSAFAAAGRSIGSEVKQAVQTYGHSLISTSEPVVIGDETGTHIMLCRWRQYQQ